MPVADCGHEHFNSHCKNNMKLNDFIEYWQKKGDAIFSVMRFRSRCCTDISKVVNSVHSNKTPCLLCLTGSPNSNDLRCLYLKDWHFCK